MQYKRALGVLARQDKQKSGQKLGTRMDGRGTRVGSPLEKPAVWPAM